MTPLLTPQDALAVKMRQFCVQKRGAFRTQIQQLKNRTDMEKLTIKPFSKERMLPIIIEFKKKERQSESIRKELFSIENLLYLLTFREQYMNVERWRYRHHEDEDWVVREAEAYLYLEAHNLKVEIDTKRLRQQIFYRIIKDRLHIGVKPWVKFEVSQIKDEEKTDILIIIQYFSNNFYPEPEYFSEQLGRITNLVIESLNNPYIELTTEDIERFLKEGLEEEVYIDEGNDHFANNFNDDSDIYEQRYRRGSIEEQGYDDHDYLWSDDREEEYDEEYYIEKSIHDHERQIEDFFKYASISVQEDEK